MKKILFIFSFIFLINGYEAYAHCQVPCGIYDDHSRVMMMLEDASTIEKAINEMNSLTSKSDVQSQNQMVRWVMNKESHAENIISTISNYFLTQRVKDSQSDYGERLIDHHKIIVLAMKAKQNSSLESISELKSSIEKLISYYPEHKH